MTPVRQKANVIHEVTAQEQQRDCVTSFAYRWRLRRLLSHWGDLKKGAITYVKARRPLIPLIEPAAGA